DERRTALAAVRARSTGTIDARLVVAVPAASAAARARTTAAASALRTARARARLRRLDDRAVVVDPELRVALEVAREHGAERVRRAAPGNVGMRRIEVRSEQGVRRREGLAGAADVHARRGRVAR